MIKKQIRDNVFSYLGKIDNKIRTKFNNICAKTGQYDVPSELFQKRTSRKNRVLISWKTVESNNMTIKQLETFSGGVVVEFVNNDFFDQKNQENDLFIELKNRLGGNDIISSMISIRTADGSSSSNVPRQSFDNLINNTIVSYKGKNITLKKSNYNNYKIRRNKNVPYTGTQNDKWEGFIYISIKGGQQDTITTHDKNVNFQLFNPACEFANEDICLDIDLVMSYFALKSIKIKSFNQNQKKEFFSIIKDVAKTLNCCEYDNSSFTGNLYDYCENHPCSKMRKNSLYDPIQVKEIFIEDFSIDDKEDERNLDFTHDEAVNKGKYYWDKKHNLILSAARPSNIFWSKHLSNMMQQNFSLSEYFQHEEEIVKRRKDLLNKKRLLKIATNKF